MTPKEIIYAVSIALQVSGSVLLLLYYFRGKTKELAVHEYFPGSNIARRDEQNNITLEKEKFQRTVGFIYKSRIAFVMLACGYLVGIAGENTGKAIWQIITLVAVLTGVILILTDKVSQIMARKKYPDDIKISYDTVKDHVETISTDNEVDKLFDDIGIGKQ